MQPITYAERQKRTKQTSDSDVRFLPMITFDISGTLKYDIYAEKWGNVRARIPPLFAKIDPVRIFSNIHNKQQKNRFIYFK
jgi:hypothetical protein